jgi:hypothetical protein
MYNRVPTFRGKDLSSILRVEMSDSGVAREGSVLEHISTLEHEAHYLKQSVFDSTVKPSFTQEEASNSLFPFNHRQRKIIFL